MSTPVITGTSARAVVTWSLDMLIEPGSVPDRPQPYSRQGYIYRPVRLRLTFRTNAVADNGIGQLALPAARMTAGARNDVMLDGIVLYGPRLRKDGRPGEHVVTENFYGQARLAPEWAQDIATGALNDLREGSHEMPDELDITDDGLATAETFLTMLLDVIDAASDQDHVTWLTRNGKRIAKIAPADEIPDAVTARVEGIQISASEFMALSLDKRQDILDRFYKRLRGEEPS